VNLRVSLRPYNSVLACFVRGGCSKKAVTTVTRIPGAPVHMFRRGFILWYVRHMGGAGIELHAEARGDEIVVTKPGTTFLLAYKKSLEEPRPVLRRSRIPPTTAAIRSALTILEPAGIEIT
jgi:hypothetical protein